MVSDMLISLSVLPALLLVLGGMLVQHAGEAEGAARRQQYYLFISGLVLALSTTIMLQLQPLQSLPWLFWIVQMLLPAQTGVIVLLMLNAKNLAGLSRQEKIRMAVLAVVLFGLLITSSLPPFSFAIYFVPGVAMLSLAWGLAARSRLWASVFIFMVLVFIAMNLFSEFSPWRNFPAWLSYLYAVVFLTSPPLIASLSALWAWQALQSAFPNTRIIPDQNPPARWLRLDGWLRLGGRLLPVVILNLAFAYIIFWASVWDHTSDGLAGLFFSQPAGITAVAAGMLLAYFSRGWKRLSGLAFALLVPAILLGAFNYGWQVSYHQITENRAARIQQALDSYYARNGEYPASLDELTPRELLWLPQPVILRGQSWCYQGGAGYYRLGTIYRQYFSSPLEVRIYASAGQPSGEEWQCARLLAELKPRYDPPNYLSDEGWQVVSDPPAPASQVSIPRQPVDPLLQSRVLSIGAWSPDGLYLALGLPRSSEGRSSLFLTFLDARSGSVCDTEVHFKDPFDISTQHAWLNDDRLFMLSGEGRPTLLTACSQTIYPLDIPAGITFEKIEAVDGLSQRLLLRDQDAAYWIYTPGDGMFNRIQTVTANPLDERSFLPAAFSPDGAYLAVNRQNGENPDSGRTLYILTADGKQVVHHLALPGSQTESPSIVEWLTNNVLLLGSSRALLVDLTQPEVQFTDIFSQIFQLEMEIPDQISGWGSLPAGDGEHFYLAVRLNHPRNKSTLLYDSHKNQVDTLNAQGGLLLISGSGQMLNFFSLENTPPSADRYDILWLDDPKREILAVQVDGHLPRSYPTLFPRYLPRTDQLVFASEQGVSLVSLPSGETIHFWELGQRASSLQPSLYPSPDGSSLAAVIDFEGLYFIRIQP